MQRSSKLTRHSHSIGVSDKNASKRQKLWQMMAMQVLSKVEKRWEERRMGILLDFEDGETYQIYSMMWADNFWLVSHSKKI